MRNAVAKGIILLGCAAVLFATGWGAGRWMTRPHPDASTRPAPRQLWTCSMHRQVIRQEPGNCPICHMRLVPLKESTAPATAPSSGAHRKIKYWWDPMIGPASIRDHPGKSAMGMDLVPVYEEETAAAGELTVDPATVQNMGVRLAPVQRGSLTRTIRAVGELRVAEPRRYEVNLRVSGWIRKLYADTTGMQLKKGEKLFNLYSPQLTVAVEELISARRQRPAAAPEDPAARAAEAVYQASRRKLRLWGLSSEQVDELAAMKTAPEVIPFFSPADGVLTEQNVVEGAAVQSGQRIMRIADESTLWLEARIFPQDMPFVHEGALTQANVEGVPGKTFTGKIIFIDPRVDPKTRTGTVRLAVENPSRQLRPGMYATVHIAAQLEKNALLIPRQAVIDTGDRQVAFIARGQGHFELREVKLGAIGEGGMAQALSGLAAGEQVVVSGQFLLDADSRMREAARRFLQEERP